MYCRKCGCKIQSGENKCPECGTEVNGTEFCGGFWGLVGTAQEDTLPLVKTPDQRKEATFSGASGKIRPMQERSNAMAGPADAEKNNASGVSESAGAEKNGDKRAAGDAGSEKDHGAENSADTAPNRPGESGRTAVLSEEDERPGNNNRSGGSRDMMETGGRKRDSLPVGVLGVAGAAIAVCLILLVNLISSNARYNRLEERYHAALSYSSTLGKELNSLSSEIEELKEENASMAAEIEEAEPDSGAEEADRDSNTSESRTERADSQAAPAGEESTAVEDTAESNVL